MIELHVTKLEVDTKKFVKAIRENPNARRRIAQIGADVAEIANLIAPELEAELKDVSDRVVRKRSLRGTAVPVALVVSNNPNASEIEMEKVAMRAARERAPLRFPGVRVSHEGDV